MPLNTIAEKFFFFSFFFLHSQGPDESQALRQYENNDTSNFVVFVLLYFKLHLTKSVCVIRSTVPLVLFTEEVKMQ